MQNPELYACKFPICFAFIYCLQTLTSFGAARACGRRREGGREEGGRVSSDSVAVWRKRISSLKVNYALIVM